MDCRDLWTLVRSTTERALASGALEPIATRPLIVEDGGVGFLVRIVENLRRKTRAGLAPNGPAPNPFLPYDPALRVGELSPTHVALLNKYNVVEQHVLLVTREFEDQELPLTEADLRAAWAALAAGPCLVFYNAGAVAGASQPHRHLQAIPCPLAPEGPAVPIEAALGPPARRWSKGRSAELAAAAKLPFRNILGWLEPELYRDPPRAAEVTLRLYRAALEASGAATGPRERTGPYNLLLTRRFLLLVPRGREHFGTISVNALGFAGALLVRDQTELDLIREHGPMAVLRGVATG